MGPSNNQRIIKESKWTSDITIEHRWNASETQWSHSEEAEPTWIANVKRLQIHANVRHFFSTNGNAIDHQWKILEAQLASMENHGKQRASSEHVLEDETRRKPWYINENHWTDKRQELITRGSSVNIDIEEPLRPPFQTYQKTIESQMWINEK